VPGCFAAGLVGAIAAAAIRPGLWWIAALNCGLKCLCWLRVRLHFRLGCVNQPSRGGRSVYTRRAHGFDHLRRSLSVIKILRHPHAARELIQSWPTVAVTVATYTGSAKLGIWEDFLSHHGGLRQRGPARNREGPANHFPGGLVRPGKRP